MKKLLIVVFAVMLAVTAFAGGWRNVYGGTVFVEADADAYFRIPVWDETGEDAGHLEVAELVGYVFNQSVVDHLQVDSVTTGIIIGKSNALVIGDGTETVVINSSDWGISATGVVTGLGAVTMGGALTGVTSITMNGALATASNVTFSGNLVGANAETIDNASNGVWNVGAATFQAAGLNYVATGSGSVADSLVFDFTPNLTLGAGLVIYSIADSANVTTITITLDGVVDSVREASDNTKLEANDIRAGMAVQFLFDGTNWQQISQSGN